MSHALPCAVLGWAEIEEQKVELLPARTVLTAAGSLLDFTNFGDEGGHGGTGGSHNFGGTGVGGPGGDASATVKDNYNFGDGIQINMNIVYGGPGGEGHGGVVHANGGDGGHGGNDFYAK